MQGDAVAIPAVDMGTSRAPRVDPRLEFRVALSVEARSYRGSFAYGYISDYQREVRLRPFLSQVRVD